MKVDMTLSQLVLYNRNIKNVKAQVTKVESWTLAVWIVMLIALLVVTAILILLTTILILLIIILILLIITLT